MKFAVILVTIWLSLAAAGEFAINVPLTPTEVDIKQIANYTMVTIPGTPLISTIGAPALPVQNKAIALPANTRATKIEIVDASYTPLRGRFTVVPATRPIIVSLADETDCPLPVEDAAVYNSSVSYPAVTAELKESSMLLGFPVAYVNIYPVRWNPASGTIEVLNNLEIKVTTEITTANYSVLTRSPQGEARTRSIVENSVINPFMVQSSGAAIVPSRALKYGEYVVIVTKEYESYAQTFADWKTRKGIPTNVYTTEWIESQYSFVDLQQEIRAFLTDCRDNGVEYVLIWGDDDIIPARIIMAKIDITTPPNTPLYLASDMYWADINDKTPGDDQWNSNADTTWGEYGVDNVDFHPDLFTGRASINTKDDAQVFLDKIMAYEQITPTARDESGYDAAPAELRIGYTTAVISPIFGSWGSQSAESIGELLPSGWSEDKRYQQNNTNNIKATEAMINAGPAHVFHSSHGLPRKFEVTTKVMFNTGHVMELKNIANGGLPAIYNSVSCNIGKMVGKNDCIADCWQNSPDGGGFGAFNSRYGILNALNAASGPSIEIIQAIYKKNWKENTITHGGMHFMGRDEIYVRNAYYNLTVLEYNLFSDPELPIWTADAPKLAVDYPSSIPGTSGVEVKVTANGSPVNNARVCLWKGDDWATAEIYEVATTNSSGQVAIWADPATTGDMLITVWAHDHISFLGSIRVTGTGIEDAVYETAIQAPYPNPAVNSATLSFSLTNAGTATIQIFDLSGRTVAVPASGNFAAGQHTLNWGLETSDGTSVPNGFYSVVITTGDTVMTERIMVLR